MCKLSMFSKNAQAEMVDIFSSLLTLLLLLVEA